ncbi:MAG: acetyl-CoA carboxylase biotin carboxyl carrier protein subunit [Rhodobiaceae bacterium]|nr:acetyl-CoA carboxylase biotin carboxyl carrier protein subunit [Rhodobiaceae bacterium]|tara:strand:+ start:137 stop:346 length:210 start_codon:yes stop_codon:yes gene_type:complete
MEIKSQIKALVWKIEKKVGDAVNKDDVIVILESMKMEIPIVSPYDGTITSININEGDEVDEQQCVATIE